MKDIKSWATDSEKHTPQQTPTTSRGSSDEDTPQNMRVLTANSIKTRKIKEKSRSIKSRDSIRTRSTVSSRFQTPPIKRAKPAGTIQINIGTMTGRIFSLDVFPTETVGQIKERISFEEGILPETQMLVYCEKHLKNDHEVLKHLGIQDGSNLQLVVHMAGGPGHPIIPKSSVSEDQVVYLLCKQNQELFVLEVHLKDGQRPRTVTKHLLRLQSPLQGNALLERLESNECFDISDICELQMGSLSVTSRPRTSDSISSFLSLEDDFSPLDTPKYKSEPSNDDMLFENDWFLTESSDPGSSSTKPRPATSISIMRLPSGTKPLIIIPKSRPATAANIIEGVKMQIENTSAVKNTKSTSSEIKKVIEPMKQVPSMSEYDFEWEPVPEPKPRPVSRLSKVTRGPTVKQSVSLQSMPRSSIDTLQQFTTKSASSSRKSSPRKSSARKTPGKPVISKRASCTQCNKKIGPAQSFTCKCKKQFCATHRYSDRHSCTYDYKSSGKKELEKNNPLVKKEKCIKL